MPLFSKNKKRGVQSFIARLVNIQCSQMRALAEGPRQEIRTSVVLVVLVVPVHDKKPVVEESFAAVTKDFSTSGVSLVLPHSIVPDDVILAFELDGTITFVRATGEHVQRLGGGFFQWGLEMTEVVQPGTYPVLESLSFDR